MKADFGSFRRGFENSATTQAAILGLQEGPGRKLRAFLQLHPKRHKDDAVKAFSEWAAHEKELKPRGY